MSGYTSQTRLVLPDFIADCDFPLRVNPHLEAASIASDEWISSCAALSPKRRRELKTIKVGTLAGMAYVVADLPRLRLCTDFLQWLFHMDDLTDDMGIKDAKRTSEVVMDVFNRPEQYKEAVQRGEAPDLISTTYDFWTRMLANSGPGIKKRFPEAVSDFLHALHAHSVLSASDTISDMTSYLKHRRDEGGVYAAFVFIEYGAALDLPDAVMDHPVMKELGEQANNLICWSNDVYSFNKEQARGDLNNLVSVVMRDHRMSMQDAFDFIGDLCKTTVGSFKSTRKMLPTWGPAIDRQVAIYVDGLEDWVIGNLHWSFDTERYFFDKGIVRGDKIGCGHTVSWLIFSRNFFILRFQTSSQDADPSIGARMPIM